MANGWNLNLHGFHRGLRRRRLRRRFLDYGRILMSSGWSLVDGEFGGRLVDSEFRDGLDGGNFFPGGGRLRRGFDFSTEAA